MSKTIKPIYYSKKTHKYYFCDVNAFGEFKAVTVYGGEKLRGGEIKTDKHGKQYILGYVSQKMSEKGNLYFVCEGFVPAKEVEYESQPTE